LPNELSAPGVPGDARPGEVYAGKTGETKCLPARPARLNVCVLLWFSNSLTGRSKAMKKLDSNNRTVKKAVSKTLRGKHLTKGGYTMNPDKAKGLLRDNAKSDDPTVLPPGVLHKLTLADLPNGHHIQIGTEKAGCAELDWHGTLTNESGKIVGYPDYTFYRKYWEGPIGLDQYVDLLAQAAEARSKSKGDVHVLDHSDDGGHFRLSVAIDTDATNLDDAYRHLREVCQDLEEPVDRFSDEIKKRLARMRAEIRSAD
jgi:hypothetical protein